MKILAAEGTRVVVDPCFKVRDSASFYRKERIPVAAFVPVTVVVG